MLEATIQAPFPVELQVVDGTTGLFPQARVYRDGVLVTTLDLSHVASGLYRATYTPTETGYLSLAYQVFSDAGHTVDAGYGLAQEPVLVAATSDAPAWSGTLTVTVVDGAAAPVAAVLVYLKDTATDLVMGQGTTDALGVVVLSHPGGDFEVVARREGYTFPVTPEALDPGEDGADTIAGTVVVIPASVVPTLCTVYAYLLDLDAAPSVGVVGIASIRSEPTLAGSGFVRGQEVAATSDANGLIQWEVPRGIRITVHVPGTLHLYVTVPNGASLDLLSLV